MEIRRSLPALFLASVKSYPRERMFLTRQKGGSWEPLSSRQALEAVHEIAGGLITAKGKLGELSYAFRDDVAVRLEDGNIWVTPSSKSNRARILWGTTRSRIFNLVKGVDEGFTVNLEIIAVTNVTIRFNDYLFVQDGIVNDALPANYGIIHDNRVLNYRIWRHPYPR